MSYLFADWESTSVRIQAAIESLGHWSIPSAQNGAWLWAGSPKRFWEEGMICHFRVVTTHQNQNTVQKTKCRCFEASFQLSSKGTWIGWWLPKRASGPKLCLSFYLILPNQICERPCLSLMLHPEPEPRSHGSGPVPLPLHSGQGFSNDYNTAKSCRFEKRGRL